MRRHLLPALSFATVVLSTAALSTAVSGCAPGLAANPRFATNEGAKPQAVAPAKPPAPPAPIAAPKKDLTWHDCTAQVFGGASIPPVPDVSLDCADYDSSLDSINGAAGTVSIGVVRARSSATPSDAGPVVLTTGTDLPSSQQLPVWLAHSGTDLLKAHPIVAVDRRGMGMSSPINCRESSDRQSMFDQAQSLPGDDPVANLAAIAQSVTTSCTDTLAPGTSAYDNAHAADDLERLRSTWDVPTLALLGIGNGAQVALAYASAHPTKVSRLALDSPLPLGINAESATEQRVKGEQAALDAFSTTCLAINCPLAPDPKGAVDALLADARAGHGVGGNSAAAISEAITTALGYPQGDGPANTAALAGVLAAARGGDAGPINALINTAHAMRQTDGQFVGSCTDAINRPTPDRVRQLMVAWPKLYPQFGATGALSLARCLSWPSISAVPDPKNLTVPILLLGSDADAIVGSEGVAAVSATAINAGTSSRRVMWRGAGHGTVVYTSCALPPVQSYFNSGKLPDTDTYCPA